jgi:hypothetical protein
MTVIDEMMAIENACIVAEWYKTPLPDIVYKTIDGFLIVPALEGVFWVDKKDQTAYLDVIDNYEESNPIQNVTLSDTVMMPLKTFKRVRWMKPIVEDDYDLP